jgi:type I restriction enzyme S subunit
MRAKKKARNEGRPGYKKTKVGWIPEEWECDQIGKYIVLLSGQHVEAKNYNNEGMGLPYLTGPTDFQNGIPNASKFTEYPKVICDEKDILITCKGSGTGTLAVADKKYCISRQIMAIRTTKINHYFALCLLKRAQSYFGKIAIGLIPGISRADILNFRIPLPPLPEQKKIAEILSAWDRAIEITNRLITNYELLKKGLMQQLLSGRMRFPEFGKPVQKKCKLTEGWKRVNLGDIAIVKMGASPSSSS